MVGRANRRDSPEKFKKTNGRAFFILGMCVRVRVR